MKNIILIGFMGVGKGSVARAIVKQSNYMAVDTDDLIESMQNKSIKKIFESEGEAFFRGLEKQTALWLESSVDNTIISTGGGFYKVENLNAIGEVVLLDSPFEEIYQRIVKHPNAEKKLKKRPLFQDLEKARELYNIREIEYKKVADRVVNVTHRSVEVIAKEILENV